MPFIGRTWAYPIENTAAAFLRQRSGDPCCPRRQRPHSSGRGDSAEPPTATTNDSRSRSSMWQIHRPRTGAATGSPGPKTRRVRTPCNTGCPRAVSQMRWRSSGRSAPPETLTTSCRSAAFGSADYIVTVSGARACFTTRDNSSSRRMELD